MSSSWKLVASHKVASCVMRSKSANEKSCIVMHIVPAVCLEISLLLEEASTGQQMRVLCRAEMRLPGCLRLHGVQVPIGGLEMFANKSYPRGQQQFQHTPAALKENIHLCLL